MLFLFHYFFFHKKNQICILKYEEFVVVTQQIEALAEGVQPLLAEVRDSTLLKDVENLTKSLAEATVDLRYNLLILPV